MTTTTFQAIQYKGAVVQSYVSVTEAAGRLGVDRRTVIRWIEAGFMPGSTKVNPMIKGSPHRVAVSAIDAVLKSRQEKAS